MYMKEISTTARVTSFRGMDGRDRFFYFFDKIKIYNYIDVEYRILISEILGFYK